MYVSFQGMDDVRSATKAKIVYNPKDVYNYTMERSTAQPPRATIYILFTFSHPCAKNLGEKAVSAKDKIKIDGFKHKLMFNGELQSTRLTGEVAFFGKKAPQKNFPGDNHYKVSANIVPPIQVVLSRPALACGKRSLSSLYSFGAPIPLTAKVTCRSVEFSGLAVPENWRELLLRLRSCVSYRKRTGYAPI